MLFWLFASLVGLGLLFVSILALAQRAVINSQKGGKTLDSFPQVSVLKPLKNIDPDLEANLRSIFEQDYPAYEVILGTELENDPALPIARKIASEYPNVPCTVISSAAIIGYNPKINNLTNLFCSSRHGLLLINDSNTRVPRDYIRDLVTRRAEAGGGLVWSLFRGSGERSIPAFLESLQLNTQVMAGACGLVKVLRMPCSLGKSMLLSVTDLEAIGGFEFLGQFLAEDQVIAEEFHKRKLPITMSPLVIDNVLGARSFKDFMGRQLRWARLRKSMNFFGYAGEILLNPVFIALVGVTCLRNAESLTLFGMALFGMAALDLFMERSSWILRPLWVYPLLELTLSLCRGVIWPLGLLGNRIIWRSNKLILKRRSRLEMG